jgi:alpha-mannosidase
MTVDGGAVMVSALKQAEDGNGYILRLYESMGEAAEAQIRIPCLGINDSIRFAPFEIRTFRLTKGNISPCPLLEKDDSL